jgi:hypothetical protein
LRRVQSNGESYWKIESMFAATGSRLVHAPSSRGSCFAKRPFCWLSKRETTPRKLTSTRPPRSTA